MSDDGVLALDAAEFDGHLRAFLEGLEPHGVDGICVVFFRGRDSGVSTCRHPAAAGERIPYSELRALALAAIQADQSSRTS